MSARPGAPARRRANEAGIALLLAVWLLALLSVIAGEFVFSSRVRAAAERNKRDDLRAFSLALAGYQAALAALDAHITGVSADADDVLLLFYERESTGTPALAKDVPLGEGTYSWRISSEDGLLSINTETSRAVFVNALKACGMQPGVDRDTVADSILDWRDSNREHRLNGAEEDYYRSLDPPYSAKDGYFDVIEELLLVRGVTPELFAGGKADGKKVPGLRDLFSVHAQADVNAATAPKAVLEIKGKTRPARPAAPSDRAAFAIVATGSPGGGAPSRSLRAIVTREDVGDSRTFSLLYWNDNAAPVADGKGEEN